MNINIMAAIISLGIWGKATQETKEKTRKASWLRTGLYLVLSVIVGIIFYKTYQVSINENSIEICKIYGSVDDYGMNTDTARVYISHRFNKDQYKDSIEYNEYVTHGGVLVDVISRPFGPKAINKKYLAETFDWLEFLLSEKLIPDTNATTNLFKRMYDAFQTNPEMENILYQYKSGVQLSQKQIDLLNLKMDYIMSDYRQLLLTRYRFTQPNSLLPWLIDDTSKKFKLETSTKYSFMVSHENIMDSVWCKTWLQNKNNLNVDWERAFKALNLQNSVMYTYLFGTSDLHYKNKRNIEKYEQHDEISRSDMKINSVNFLTAADLSQGIYEINIHSDIPLEVLRVDFDIPVNISSMYPEPDMKSMREIVFHDREKLDYIQSQKIKFHVKFPTLENQQLIRSLILTTILTAIVSMFFANLYFCIRRFLLRKHRNHKIESCTRFPNLNSIPIRYRKRMIWYKKICIIAYAFAILFLLYLFIRLLFNDPVSFTTSEVLGVCLKVFMVILAVIVFLTFAYRMLIPRRHVNADS
jgi:hypothetical protein